MAKIYVCVAPGLEEVECLAAVDVMRRCSLEVTLASMGEEKLVTGSHQISILTDELFNGENCRKADMIYLPGGMPGTMNLLAHEGLKKELVFFAETEGKRLAAICAAPLVLGQNGLLQGVKATCYPGNEDKLTGAVLTDAGIVTDGKFTTGKGLGVALDMGLEIVRIYCGEQVSEDCRKKIQYSGK